MSNLSRSQSSERMHVVPGPISATCVCRRLVPSNIWMSLFLTSALEAEPGGSAMAARTGGAAVRARVIRTREANADALAVAPRDASEAEADILSLPSGVSAEISDEARAGARTARAGVARVEAGRRSSGLRQRVYRASPAWKLGRFDLVRGRARECCVSRGRPNVSVCHDLPARQGCPRTSTWPNRYPRAFPSNGESDFPAN